MLLHLLPRFREAQRSLLTLADRERWPRADIECYQLERINQVWHRARSECAHYRNLSDQMLLPRRFTSLFEYSSLMPILAKDQVRCNPFSIFSQSPEPGKWKRTGGSTGTPMRVYWSRQAHREMLRCEYRYYDRWGADFRDRAAWIWGHGASFAPGWSGFVQKCRQPIEDLLRNRLRLSAYRLGYREMAGYLDRIQQFRPGAIFGYSQAVWLLSQIAEDFGFQLPSLKLITLTGEPAPPSMLRDVSRGFDAPAATIYGSVECGALAQQSPDGTLRVREDHVFIETLPRDDGRYDIVVSVLNNPSFPLLRYAIGDVTDEPLEHPITGFSILENVVGRSSDFVLSRTGRYVHPARFEALFHYEFAGVHRSLVHQAADGSVKISLVAKTASTTLDLERIEATVCDLLEGYRVTAQVVDSLPISRSGKQRLVVSDLLQELRSAPKVENGMEAMQVALQ